MPNAITKTLLELERASEDYMPLIRFWRKLSKSTHQNSKEQLYSFILHNKIQITEQGDIVLEKGVKRKNGGLPDELVDDRTGTIDHSIGSYVSMPREKVVDDKNQTCSAGLHCAPPSYVRQFYGSHILVELIVDPRDVVSVPVDYNSRKIRCCAYRVMGYSPKEQREKQIIKLSEFITNLDNDSIANTVKEEIKEKVSTIKNEEILVQNKEKFNVVNLGGLSAKAVVALTMKTLGCETFGGSEPRKANVLKIAEKKFSEAGYTVSMNENARPVKPEVEEKITAKVSIKDNTIQWSVFDNITAKAIVKLVISHLSCVEFGGKEPRKAQVLKIAEKLYNEHNWKIIK